MPENKFPIIFTCQTFIQRALKTLCPKKSQTNRTPLIESLENLRNSQSEICYEEIVENTANEAIQSTSTVDNHHQSQFAAYQNEGFIFYPINFVQTDCGLFYWQNILSKYPPADQDLRVVNNLRNNIATQQFYY